MRPRSDRTILGLIAPLFILSSACTADVVVVTIGSVTWSICAGSKASRAPGSGYVVLQQTYLCSTFSLTPPVQPHTFLIWPHAVSFVLFLSHFLSNAVVPHFVCSFGERDDFLAGAALFGEGRFVGAVMFSFDEHFTATRNSLKES